jgi:hypothetical protein
MNDGGGSLFILVLMVLGIFIVANNYENAETSTENYQRVVEMKEQGDPSLNFRISRAQEDGKITRREMEEIEQEYKRSLLRN